MIENLLTELRATSRLKEKEQVLLSHDSEILRGLIVYAYDPFKNFNVNIKPMDIPHPGEVSIEAVWDKVKALFEFCEGSMSNKQNREKAFETLLGLNEKSQELVVNTINKNWKAGVSKKTLLKLFPGIVAHFVVQLANVYNPDKHDCTGRIWSYKLDGLRCVALRYSSGWILYSRQGKEFLTVEHLKPQLEHLYKKFGWTFFDGELYKHGWAFEAVQGAVMGFTKGQVPDIEYHVFVAGSASNFLSGTNEDQVNIVFGPSHLGAPGIKFVNQGPVGADEDVKDIIEEAFSLGYEGIMLRDPNQLYDYKRSDALLKYKQGEEDGEIISDCVVTRIDTDRFPVIEGGRLHYESLLVRLWVQQADGVECKVGSGFDLEFRRKYTEKPWELIGKDVEIKHQQWGSGGRMRFPRLIKVREDL